MADLATLQTRLTEAETALHKLSTGSMAEEVTSPDGSRVRYMVTDIVALNRYVAALTAQIAALQSTAAAGTPTRAPVYLNPYNYD